MWTTPRQTSPAPPPIEECCSLAEFTPPTERLCEAMACTSLVAAKSGTKGKLRPLQTGTTLRRLVGATLVAHDKEKMRQTVGQAQFATAEPAGTHGAHDASPDVSQGRLGMAATGLHKRVRGAIKGKVPTSIHNKMPHLLAFEAHWLTQPTRAISRNEKGDTM